jgi:hypothetical protein
MIGLLIRNTDQNGSLSLKALIARQLCGNTCRNMVSGDAEPRRCRPEPASDCASQQSHHVPFVTAVTLLPVQKIAKGLSGDPVLFSCAAAQL